MGCGCFVNGRYWYILCHIVENIHDIVVVFEAFDETVDIFLFLGGELTHGERYTLELKGLDFEVMVFEILGDGTVILEVGENIYLSKCKHY